MELKFKNESWYLHQYPFFETEIKDHSYPNTNTDFYYCSGYDNLALNHHKTIESAYKAMVECISKACKLILVIDDFDTISKIHGVRMFYGTWQNNSMKRHSYESCKQFHYVFGIHLPNSMPSRNRTFAYSKDISEEQAKAHAIKVIKRHAKRFLKEFS